MVEADEVVGGVPKEVVPASVGGAFPLLEVGVAGVAGGVVLDGDAADGVFGCRAEGFEKRAEDAGDVEGEGAGSIEDCRSFLVDFLAGEKKGSRAGGEAVWWDDLIATHATRVVE